MSLVQEYSSDEDSDSSSLKNDAFGLHNLPISKKIRVEAPESSLQPQAAPHVLAEVRHL
jgi:pre-mRNA-processing factor 17